VFWARGGRKRATAGDGRARRVWWRLAQRVWRGCSHREIEEAAAAAAAKRQPVDSGCPKAHQPPSPPAVSPPHASQRPYRGTSTSTHSADGECTPHHNRGRAEHTPLEGLLSCQPMSSSHETACIQRPLVDSRCKSRWEAPGTGVQLQRWRSTAVDGCMAAWLSTAARGGSLAWAACAE
jgi:hypothetical protein